MASEAISSSILLIGAVLGAVVLVTAILPAIFSAGDTFGTVSSSAENKMKTDFRIVNTFAPVSALKINEVQVWMKNVGATQISLYDIKKSDVFFGSSTIISHYTNSSTIPFQYYDSDTGDNSWNVGETLEIKISGLDLSSDDILSFTFSLPNGVRRTISFSANK